MSVCGNFATCLFLFSVCCSVETGKFPRHNIKMPHNSTNTSNKNTSQNRTATSLCKQIKLLEATSQLGVICLQNDIAFWFCDVKISLLICSVLQRCDLYLFGAISQLGLICSQSQIAFWFRECVRQFPYSFAVCCSVLQRCDWYLLGAMSLLGLMYWQSEVECQARACVRKVRFSFAVCCSVVQRYGYGSFLFKEESLHRLAHLHGVTAFMPLSKKITMVQLVT